MEFYHKPKKKKMYEDYVVINEGLMDIIHAIKRRSGKCDQETDQIKDKRERKYKKMLCQAAATKSVIHQLTNLRDQCNGTDDVHACQQKIDKNIMKWKSAYKHFVVQLASAKYLE
jgi:hypothetical protein